MSLFQRVFGIGKAEVHGALDKIEDPVKMTEQGIRDLRSDLEKSINGLAEVKANAIQARKRLNDQRRRAQDYVNKASLLEQRAADDSAQLATKALAEAQTIAAGLPQLEQDAVSQEAMATQLSGKIEQLKTTIRTYENELTTLKARAQTAKSVEKINKVMAGADSSGTVAMLERMKQKVDVGEARAQAYGELAEGTSSLDDELAKALPAGGATGSSNTQQIDDLKKQLGM